MRVVRTASMWLLAMVLASACATAQPSAPAPSATPGSDRADNQRLVLGIESVPATLDPVISVLGRNYDIFETLTAADPESKRAEPMLASSWKSIDATTWEFTIQANSKFHNGDPVTANDVKFTFDRYFDPASRSIIPSRFPLLDQVTVIDAGTIRFTTKAPDPLFVRRFYDAAIMPEKYIKSLTQYSEFVTKPVGSGPFKVKEMVAGDRLVLEAVKEHPTRSPIVTELVLRQIPEQAARVNGMRTGDLDYIDRVPPDVADVLKNNFEVKATDIFTSQGCFTDSDLAGTATQDRRVRLALNYAIDRETLSKNVFRGYMKPAFQPVQVGTVGFNASLKPYPYDPAQAKRLLAEAGYPNGFKMTIDGRFLGVFQSMIELIQANFRDIGVEAEVVQIMDGTLLAGKFRGDQRRVEMSCQRLSARSIADADFALTWFTSTQPGGNGSGTKHWDNKGFDRLYIASTTEMDPAKRAKLLEDAIALMYADPTWLAIVDEATITAAQPKIKGIVYRTDQWPFFHQAYRAK